MQDPPDKTVLLGAIARFLASDVLPAVADPALGFRVRIAAHLVGMVARETSAEQAHDQAELDGLIALGMADSASGAAGIRAAIADGRRRLADALRTGALTDQADAALVASLRDRLAVGNPKFTLDRDLGDDPWIC